MTNGVQEEKHVAPALLLTAGLGSDGKRVAAFDKGEGNCSKIERPKVRRGLTAYLFLLAAIGIAISTASYCVGALQLWAHLTASIPLYWFCYVAAHDSVHRAAHRNKGINNLIGWFSTGLFGLPFSLMRTAHLSHHRHVEKEEDIESFAYRMGWQLPFGILFGNLFFYSYFPKCDFRQKLSTIGFVASLMLVIFGLASTKLLLGWFLPMQLVFGFGMFTNIYLPHGPHAEWLDKNMPFVTGFHEHHHAIPSYPWHQLCRTETRIACAQKDKLRTRNAAVDPIRNTVLTLTEGAGLRSDSK